ASRKQRKKSGVEGEHGIGSGEIVAGLEGLAEGESAPLQGIAAIERLILMPLGFRIALKQRFELVGEGRGGDGFGEYPQALPLGAPEFVDARRDHDEKCVPSRDATAVLA